jgi:ABC-type transport system involved in multi-copper enzyme maturation permease subunit
MNTKFLTIRIFIVALAASLLGTALIAVVASLGRNAYAAGFLYLPLFLLVIAASILAFGTAIFLLSTNSKSQVWALLFAFALFLPLGFFGSNSVAKNYEIGAYKNAPMEPLPVVSPR